VLLLPGSWKLCLWLLFWRMLGADCCVALLATAPAACLAGLLHRDPSRRLGSRGAAEIKAHPFFELIDWGMLQTGQVRGCRFVGGPSTSTLQ
jgi:hypothetical protein